MEGGRDWFSFTSEMFGKLWVESKAFELRKR